MVVQLAPPAATAAPAATPAVPPAQATPAPTAPTPDDDALVRVIDYLPGVSQQLVYATDENFTGRPIYGFTDAYLRYGTVQKLGQAAAALEQLGLTLVIWDATGRSRRNRRCLRHIRTHSMCPTRPPAAAPIAAAAPWT